MVDTPRTTLTEIPPGPWSRQPGEPLNAYTAFRAFLRARPRRDADGSYGPRVWSQVGLSGAMARWDPAQRRALAEAYGWLGRAAALDDYYRAVVRALWERRGDVDRGEALPALLASASQPPPEPAPMSGEDLQRLLALVAEVQGQPAVEPSRADRPRGPLDDFSAKELSKMGRELLKKPRGSRCRRRARSIP